MPSSTRRFSRFISRAQTGSTFRRPGRDEQGAAFDHVEGQHRVVETERHVGKVLIVDREGRGFGRQAFQCPAEPVAEKSGRAADEGGKLAGMERAGHAASFVFNVSKGAGSSAMRKLNLSRGSAAMKLQRPCNAGLRSGPAVALSRKSAKGSFAKA